ncbi:unnamed protein product [Euphydryas editha]|uniref:ISXO2-like transposase domain-containing protein n=1 Tax=Euphydryas editha TaxID=104508 RepID=A0AAU9TBE2_EUPED|nr:unnamed protein product [Euphydryas editha]
MEEQYNIWNYSHSATVAEDTWFERYHTSAQACILITYCFAKRMTFEQTKDECSIVENEQVSTETIADRFSFCREVCMVTLDDNFETEGQSGGEGEIIEIDECKIGRRKYERGRIVEGTWVLGINHRGHPENYRLEICTDNKRDSDTLLKLIKKHVKIESTIHTDCWKGYLNLNQHGYVHDTVNHNFEFVNSETGAHTQNIESSWRWMRRELSRGGVRSETMADHLCDFLWRRRVKKLNKNPFNELLENIKSVYPGK